MSETAAGVAHVQDVVNEVMVAHAARGAKLQAGLRLGVVAFVWACLLLDPPSSYAGWCYAVAVAYPVLWAASLVWVGRPRVAGTDPGWLLLVLDIVVLGVLTLIAGLSAENSWTAYIIINGFFLLPVLAATQLRPSGWVWPSRCRPSASTCCRASPPGRPTTNRGRPWACGWSSSWRSASGLCRCRGSSGRASWRSPPWRSPGPACSSS